MIVFQYSMRTAVALLRSAAECDSKIRPSDSPFFDTSVDVTDGITAFAVTAQSTFGHVPEMSR